MLVTKLETSERIALSVVRKDDDVFNKLKHLTTKTALVGAKLEWVIKHLSGEELERARLQEEERLGQWLGSIHVFFLKYTRSIHAVCCYGSLILSIAPSVSSS